MKRITDVITEIHQSLAGVRIRAGESIMLEIWTIDGIMVGEAARGVKITIPFKSISEAAEKQEPKDGTAAARRPRRMRSRGI